MSHVRMRHATNRVLNMTHIDVCVCPCVCVSRRMTAFIYVYTYRYYMYIYNDSHGLKNLIIYAYHVEILDHFVWNSENNMEWQQLVSSLKISVSFSKEPHERDLYFAYVYVCTYTQKSPYFCRARLQQRTVFLGSLQSVDTP